MRNTLLEEADRHLRSAKALRSIRQRRKAAYGKAEHFKKLHHVLMMDAVVHSSTLLIACAFELLLKAGLTRMYVGCSKPLFGHDVKRRFGHNLCRIAREIDCPLSSAGKKLLRELQDVILAEGRYPFLSIDSRQDMARRNKRAQRFWNDHRFRTLLALFQSIRKHVASLDQDSGNPASFISVDIDGDGYFAFRCGGNLSTRIVVKYSSQQRRLRQNNPRALRRLILANIKGPLLRHFWDSANYRCVKL